MQGVQLTQDAEKKRTDDEDKGGEKRNSKLASRVIQYSQLGSLVLQSVKTAAAGKYACQATNGIENDSIENKTMSNTVRLLVKREYNIDISLLIYAFESNDKYAYTYLVITYTRSELSILKLN